MRGQATLEFTILFSFISIIFITVFVILGNRMVDLNREKQLESITAIQEIIMDEVELAHSVEDGYFRVFQVPNTILGEDYNMSIAGSMLNINFHGEDHGKTLPQPAVGGFCFPASRLNYYNISIMRQSGVVSVSSCSECRYSYAVCQNAEDNGWCDWLSSPMLLPGFNETCCEDHCVCCP
jgi:hypothetical protein